jgi:hypothetical protein
LSDAFSIQNGVKHGDTLSPLVLNFASEYAIRKAGGIKTLEMNGAHEPLSYSDSVNSMDTIKSTRKKNTTALLDSGK